MKTIDVSELTERINEILRLVEDEGETIEVINHGKVIAHIVPTVTPVQQTQPKQDMEAFWEKTDRLAAEIGSYLPEKVDVNDIMLDVRLEEHIKKDSAAWENLNRIASELEPYWPIGVDAVEIVRDIRRDL